MSTPCPVVVPRLLDAVPTLAAPIERVEPEIFAWASTLGLGVVYSRTQFERLLDVARPKSAVTDMERRRFMDLRFAAGTLTALDRRPPTGWEGYLDIWTGLRLANRLKVYEKSDFSRLRELEERVGGILLNDRAMPLVLILPQPGGSYVQMGWESVVELESSPFLAGRRSARVLREHLVPEAERTVVAPVA